MIIIIIISYEITVNPIHPICAVTSAGNAVIAFHELEFAYLSMSVFLQSLHYLPAKKKDV